jgi:hypothetical protein
MIIVSTRPWLTMHDKTVLPEDTREEERLAREADARAAAGEPKVEAPWDIYFSDLSSKAS